MTRIKNFGLTILTAIVGLVTFLVFASFGLAVLGAVAVVALLGGAVALVRTLAGRRRTTLNI